MKCGRRGPPPPYFNLYSGDAVACLTDKEAGLIADGCFVGGLNLFDEAVELVLVNERDCTAAKAGTGHSGTKAAFLLLCCFCKSIKLNACYLVIFLEGFVAGV